MSYMESINEDACRHCNGHPVLTLGCAACNEGRAARQAANPDYRPFKWCDQCKNSPATVGDLCSKCYA